MNSGISITNGRNAYIVNAAAPLLIAIGGWVAGGMVVSFYISVLICHVISLAYYKPKGVGCRFNAMQSVLLVLIAGGCVLGTYELLGFEGYSLSESVTEALSLRASSLSEWVYTIMLASIALGYYGLCGYCWMYSKKRVFPLPMIGSWAWQSAILDDTSGEYASLDEAAQLYNK